MKLHNPNKANISEKAVFVQLYEQFHQQLCYFALKFIYDTQAAQDLVQEVFIGMWQNRENLELQRTDLIKKYMYQAVTNKCISYLKRNKRQKEHLNNILLDLLSNSSGYSDYMISSELSDRIKELINELPEKSREIFQLSRAYGYPNKEIAQKVELSEKSVEYHITKSLKFLRDNLQEYLALIIILIVLNNLFK